MLYTNATHLENEDTTHDNAISNAPSSAGEREALTTADLLYETMFQKIGHAMFQMPTNQGKVLQIMCAAGGQGISAKEIQAFLGKTFKPDSFRILIWRLSRIIRNIPDISFVRHSKELYRLDWLGENTPAVQEQRSLVKFYNQVKLTFRELTWREHKIYLHETQYTILRHLFSHPEQVVESDELLDQMDILHDNLPLKRTLDCHISRIRAMLTEFPLTLTTVRGVGFVLHKNDIEDISSIINRYEAVIGKPIYKCRNRAPKIGGRQTALITQTFTDTEYSALLRAIEQILRAKLANTKIRFIYLKEILPAGTSIGNIQVKEAATKVIESYMSGNYLYPSGCNYYAKNNIKLGNSYFDTVCSGGNTHDGRDKKTLSLPDCIEQDMCNVG